MKNILICNPNIYNSYIYLPGIWGLLKTFCNQDTRIKKNFNWLPPIYLNYNADILLQDYDIESIDVLGLSCYIWNFATNMKIAKLVKQVNPKCLIVIGGPQPDWNDKSFFDKHPYVDLIVRQDGEIPFKQILLKVLDNDYNFEDVKGLYLPGMKFTGHQELLRNFEKSYWLENKEYYENLIRKIKSVEGRRVLILFETDRGCPYGCTFCDWGSNTMSKIRKYPLQRVMDEIEWIGQQGIHTLEFTNANLGIFKDDIEIVRKLAEVKQKYDHPKQIFYSSAKNNAVNVIEIAKIAFDAGLINQQQLALQSTSKGVLAATKRTNLPVDKQKLLTSEMRKHNIPMVPQLIRGQPGDTFESFKNSINDIMLQGIIGQFQVFLFMVLPNAPANDPLYKKTWKMELVERYSSVTRRKIRNPFVVSSLAYYCVATKTYTREDYVKMWLYSTLIIDFLGCAITRFVSVYLWLTCNIEYKEFYSNLFDNFIQNPKYPFTKSVFDRVKLNMEKFVDPNVPATEVFEEFVVEELGDYHSMLESEEYVLFKILTNFDSFWNEFEQFMFEHYGNIKNLDSILNYQKNIMITPLYDPRVGKKFVSDHHWLEYFKKADETFYLEKLDEPEIGSICYQIEDRACGSHDQFILDWYKYNGLKRNIKFLEACIGSQYNRSNRTFFKKIYKI